MASMDVPADRPTAAAPAAKLESVDPREIEHTALAEALFLQRYAASSAVNS